jgi:hypothetical protein
MSESGDYSPAPWAATHDFKSARALYDRHAGRSYDDAIATGKTAKDLVPDKLETQSTCPLVIVCDVTGSMGEWPAVIFSKLPYLDHEARTEYLGPDVEISFAAAGDAFSDQYPLQARPFAKGKDLKTRLEELVIEGNGGGSTQESYELAALYYARRTEMPNANKPIIIFIGDESPYDGIDATKAKALAGVKVQDSLTTKQVFEELKNRFEVYFIQKPYGNSSFNSRDVTTDRVHKDWAKLVGEDHIAQLPEAQRVVDVIFGILAAESGRIDYFRTELEDRQKPEQIATVYEALTTVHALPPGGKSVKKLRSGTSTLHPRSKKS